MAIGAATCAMAMASSRSLMEPFTKAPFGGTGSTAKAFLSGQEGIPMREPGAMTGR